MIRALITLICLFVAFCANAQSASSTMYTRQQLQEALTGTRDIRFWSYMHKQGSTNIAVRGISLDSLFSALDSLGISGGGGGTVIAYYQNTQNNGSNLLQRNTVNFKSGNPNLTVVASDNPGSSRTDVTITAPGGAVSSGSDEIVIVNGSGASLKPFSVQFVPANVDIDELSGSLPFSMLDQGGATNGMVPIWTPSGWVPGLISSGGSYVAGSGISIAANAITNTGDLNPSDDLLVTDAFGGDVSGVYSNLVIDNGAITGTKINQSGAVTGQVLKWDGTTWAPANDAGGTAYTQGAGITISGGIISNSGDPDASNDLTTTTTFSGEVFGSYASMQTIKWVKKPVNFTPGATTFTVTGSQPNSLNKVMVHRNGINLVVGDHVLYSTGTYTLFRPLASGERLDVYFQE